MKISSGAFTMNGSIPSKYTCDGMDINPPLTIENVPTEAKSLVLIVDDPDAPRGMWVHWVVWNIDPATKEIKENSVPPGSSQGMTDFRKQKYGGPCPPSGVHRYFFKLYALSSTLTLAPNAGKVAVEQAMKVSILAQTELIGLYTRKK
jgi:Raf kinase inhibitor-like YbhB/YbcL family protein